MNKTFPFTWRTFLIGFFLLQSTQIVAQDLPPAATAPSQETTWHVRLTPAVTSPKKTAGIFMGVGILATLVTISLATSRVPYFTSIDTWIKGLTTGQRVAPAVILGGLALLFFGGSYKALVYQGSEVLGTFDGLRYPLFLEEGAVKSLYSVSGNPEEKAFWARLVYAQKMETLIYAAILSAVFEEEEPKSLEIVYRVQGKEKTFRLEASDLVDPRDLKRLCDELIKKGVAVASPWKKLVLPD